MASQFNLYKRISLEFINTFPGQVYLRFEPFSKQPAIMIQVLPGDIVFISELAEPYKTGPRKGERVTAVEADETVYDDDFQPGDS